MAHSGSTKVGPGPRTDLKERLRRNGVDVAFIALFAAALCVQLFVPPVVGQANNGDFERMMDPLGLRYRTASREDRYFVYTNLKFDVRPSRATALKHPSSEYAVGRIARAMTSLTGTPRLLDIRSFGLVHAIFLAAGASLLLRSTSRWRAPLRVVVALLLLIIFTDVGYVAPLNSMYMSAASLVFLFCAAGSAALMVRDQEPSRGAVFRFAIFGVLFVASKPQESIQALPLAALVLLIAGRKPSSRTTAAVAAAALLLTGGLYYFRGTPYTLRLTALYHAVYAEVLQNSPDPAGDLQDLGLPAHSAKYIGKHAYDPQGGFSDVALMGLMHERVGFAQLTWFYLTHPQRAASACMRALPYAFDLRGNFGNHTRAEALERGRMSDSFDLWSGVRNRGRSRPGLIAAIIAVFILIGVVLAWQQSRPAGIALTALCWMALGEFLMSALLNAHIELERHLLTFHAMIDLLLISAVVAVLSSLRAQAAYRGWRRP